MDIRTSMPAMKSSASVKSATGNGTRTHVNATKNSSKVINGKYGARVNDTTSGAERGGEAVRTGRGPPSPARKNTKTKKRQQRVDPPSYPTGSSAKGEAKDTTKPLYPIFANKGITKIIPGQNNSVPVQPNPFLDHTNPSSTRETLSPEELIRLRKETEIA